MENNKFLFNNLERLINDLCKLLNTDCQTIITQSTDPQMIMKLLGLISITPFPIGSH